MPARRPVRPARLRLEPIEDRAVPAALALAGGVLTYTAAPGEANALTVSVSGANYRFNDAAPITAAPAGWAGAGTPTVSGPTAGVTRVVVDLGNGADVLNVRATPVDLTATSAGSLAVSLSSDAPANTGTVAGIGGNVTVTGGGSGSLAVGNAGGAGATVTVTQTQISGLLPGGKVIGYANVGSLRVATSDAPDTVTVNVTAGTAAVRVDTNGGDDAVTVAATRGPTAVNAGAGNDTIAVGTAGAGLDGVTGALTVDAGAGATNTLTLDDTAAAAGNAVTVTAARVAGLAPVPVTYRAVGGAFAGITLQGSDTQADAFTLAGSATAHKFTVRGNGGADTFTVTGTARADLLGGAGDDTVTLAADGVTLTGSIDGGSGENTLSYAGRSAAVGVTLTGPAAGTGTGLNGAFSNVAALVGGGGNDTLTGPNAANAWFLTGSNAGLFGVGPLFSAFENLTGGTADDTFSFAFGPANGSVTGSIGGGAGGSDRLNYAGVPGAVAVTLTGAAGGTGTRIGGTFSDIDVLTGNGSASTLTGRNAATTWTVSGTDGGSISGGPTFAGFANLTGGTADDTFHFSGGTGKTTGTLSGGGGTTNSVRFSGYAGGVTVNLQAAAATMTAGGAGVVAAFSGVNDYQGNAGGGDVLVGPNAPTTWTVTGADAGTVGAVGFGGFENLSGGTAADTFAFRDGGSVSGAVDAGGGTDTLDFSARTGAVAVALTNHHAGTTAAIAGGFVGVDAHTGNGTGSTLTGYSGGATANTWTVTGADTGSLSDGANATAFAGYANLAGGPGNDTFVYAGGAGKTSGSVAAGAGTLGSLRFEGFAGGVTVNLQTASAAKTTGGAAVVAAFSGINDVESDAAAGDTLAGPNAAATWAVSGANAGTVAGVAFRGMENLRGGSAADTFALAGTVAGTVDGGGGANALDYTAAPGAQALTLTGLGGAAGFDGTGSRVGGFKNVSAVTAAAGPAHALTGRNTAATWTVDDAAGPPAYASGGRTLTAAGFRVLTGGTAADTFQVRSTAGGISYTLDGGPGADAFTLTNLNAQLAALTLAGGPGTDTLAVDDGANGTAAAWILAAGTVSRDGLTFDSDGFEGTVVTTGTGANAVAVEGTAAGQTLTVNAGGTANDISVGQMSNRYDLAGGVTVNLTNAASVDSLTVNDTAADPGPAAWTLSAAGVARSGAAAVQLTGAMELVVLSAGDGGAAGNAVDITGSAVTAFAVSGGPGTADALTVHDGADDGLDDGVSRVAFTGALQPVDYFDFDLVPLVVD
ncbi:MAG: hypothetical protein K2X82_23870 [Gemmataceae bacterium]|nr:hypothetical protein [Gemmataceae bacterium]